jgi:hypothetical protein
MVLIGVEIGGRILSIVMWELYNEFVNVYNRFGWACWIFKVKNGHESKQGGYSP